MVFSEDTMASIFRAPYGDSSTESVETSENEVSNASANENSTTDSMPRSSLQTSAALVRLSGSHPQLPNIEPHQHSTLFYLSLIEGRCRTQAAGVLNQGRLPHEQLAEHHPEVRSLAQHLFGEMVSQISTPRIQLQVSRALNL
jgi:translation initiation factor 2-alpha kinase 3